MYIFQMLNILLFNIKIRNMYIWNVDIYNVDLILIIEYNLNLITKLLDFDIFIKSCLFLLFYYRINVENRVSFKKI